MQWGDKKVVRWGFIAVIAGLIVLGVGRQLLDKYTLNNAPKLPSNLPKEAVWAGGVDGGAWYVINSQQAAPDVWQIKVYNDDGHPWVRGNFWWKGATNAKLPLPLSAFDGRIIYLEGNKKMLPVGEHFYPSEGYPTTVIIYPNPSPDYTELRQVGQRQSNPELW